MQLKRLWDTDNKKIVFTEWPTWHQCQVWTDESWNLYIYDMAQWLTYNWTSPEGKEYDRSNWEALTDQVVWFYDTDKPSELFSWDHGDDAYYQFVDWDGTVLKSWTVIEWWTPTAPANPTRPSDARYTYTFAWWTPAVGPISKRTTYTATYTATLNEYTITWVDGDGNTLDTDTVEYWETPTYAWETPTKAPDAEYIYTWDGWWTPDVVAVTWNATYTATFTATAVIAVTSISNFSKTTHVDIIEWGSTTFTFSYLPANANSFANVELETYEGTWYDGRVDTSVSYDNGTATVTVSDKGGAWTTFLKYELNAKLNNNIVQEITWDILNTFTVTFVTDTSMSTGSWTVTPNPINNVPYWTVVDDNDNVMTFTNTNVWFSATATAIPDEWSELWGRPCYWDVTEDRECGVVWNLIN